VLYLQLLLSNNREVEAREMGEIWITNYAKNPNATQFFGDLFLQSKNFKNAIFYYKKGITLEPNAAQTHFKLGQAYQQLNQLDKAIVSFTAALDQNPELHEARFSLGVCLSTTGKPEKAIEHFEMFIRKYPEDVAGLNNLALLYEQVDQLAKAKLTWLKVKEAAIDEIHKQRAEAHLFRLLKFPDKRDTITSTSPTKSNKKDSEGKGHDN
jgi:tetratricopeptide (TPR) repeat protein